jgi:predicted nucleic acid-binding protein
MSRRVFLLDTNVLVALVRGNELGTRIDAAFGLRAARTRPLVSIVTHGEVRVLARWNRWGERKLAILDRALANLVTVDINHPKVVDAYVAIDLHSRGLDTGARNMGKNDLWIAACAKAASATLLTTDRDFEHLDGGLVEVGWIDPVAGRGGA